MKENQTVAIGNFSFEIPANWQHYLDENILTIYNDSEGEGAIQISNFEIPKEYEFNLFDEFYDFVSENILTPNDKHNFYKEIRKIKEGFLSIELVKEDRFFILSMYYHEHSVLLITYNCKLNAVDKEKKVVEFFLAGIKIKK